MAQHEPLTPDQILSIIADAISAAHHLGTKGDTTELAHTITDTTRLVGDWLRTENLQAVEATIKRTADTTYSHLIGGIVARVATEVAVALGCDNRVNLNRIGNNYRLTLHRDGQPIEIVLPFEEVPDDPSSITEPEG